MAKFDEIKKSVGEAAEMLAEKAAGLAKVAAEKTKDAAEKAKELAKIGKLNAEILAQKDDIRKAYQEIGKLYYEYFQVDPHEPMKAACEKIDTAMAIIADKQAEIEVLKAENPDEDFDDYEIVEDDDYCEAVESGEEDDESVVTVKATLEIKLDDEEAAEEAAEEVVKE